MIVQKDRDEFEEAYKVFQEAKEPKQQMIALFIMKYNCEEMITHLKREKDVKYLFGLVDE